ncbi:cytochrome P450 [Rhizophagus irregularis]|nr:cytochrome P450 [Rhizophagus irregularis]
MVFKPLKNFEINDYVLSLLSTILMTYVVHYYYKYFTRVNPLPGPFPFPFIGNLPQIYWWFKGDFQKFYDYCYRQYGDIYEIHDNLRFIVLCRAEYLENFFSFCRTSAHWMRYPSGSEELGIINKGILFNNNYKSWVHSRHFISQAILSPKFSDETINWTNKLFNELENYWNKLFLKEEIIKENKVQLDFSKWFDHYTNDMIISLLIGEISYSMAAYFDTLSGDSDEKSDYQLAIFNDSAKLVQAIRKHLAEYYKLFSVPSFLRKYIPFFKNKTNDMLHNMGFINQRLSVIIKRRRQEIDNTPLDEPLPYDMLTSMIIKNTPRDGDYFETGESMRSMTDSEIRANLLDGIITGTHKSANLLSFIIYYIAHNPDVKKKMLEEIDSIFQGDKIRPITKDDFYNLNYCEAIVNEAARIFPVVHSFTRCIDKSDEIAGRQWLAGTTVLINVKAIHNNEGYWEKPNKFNPDRWMNENFKPKKNSYIAFGGGLRSCPGRKLAIVELVCLIALLFRRYEIDLIDMDSPIKVISDNIAVTCVELLVEIKLRNSFSYLSNF